VTGKELKRKLFPSGQDPEWAIVLGSGFDVWIDHIATGEKVPFHHVDGLSGVSVRGHGGYFTAGRVSGKPVVVAGGRLHLYEGRTAAQVVGPVRTLIGMGITGAVLSTAVGAVNAGLTPGDRVVITDQLNLTLEDPHSGSGGFPDMSRIYDKGCIDFLRDRGFKPGILAGIRGPSYETPAEVRALGVLGADVVCMSTVLEAMVLKSSGIRCAGVAVVANRAGSPGVTHEEVLKTVRMSADQCWPAIAALMVSGSG